MTELLELSSPAVKINGQSLEAMWLDALIALRVERAVCLVSRAVLRFSDPGYVLSSTQKIKLGSAVQISLSNATELMSGVVTGTGLEQSAGAHPEFVVTVDDYGYKLGLNSRVQTFLQLSFADVIRKIVSQNGLAADINATAALQATNDYLLQSGSDLGFVDELVRRGGCVWWMADKTLTVRQAGTSEGTAGLALGADLTEFSVRASGLRPLAVNVSGWDAKSQAGLRAANKPATKTADSQFVTAYVGTAPAGGLGNSAQLTGADNPNTQSEATSLATARHVDWHAGAVVARGSAVVNAAVKPMAQLEITNAGPSSGKYLASSVEHVYRRDGFYTRFTAGPQRPAGLVDTLGPAAPDPGFAVTGLVTAKVTDSKDPDDMGRVKVNFIGTGDQVESAWARVVALGGGVGRGAMFHPEVNDEVLVGFERGDTRHPVVLGGLYSPKARTPADSKLIGGDSKVSYRRITSRLGHVIELADGVAPTEQHILLRLAGEKHRIRLGADQLDVETEAGKPITVKSGSAKFAIDAMGNITMEGAKITIKASQDLTLEGLSVSAKAKVKASLEGTNVDVKGSAMTNVQASGPLALKGAIVQIN